MIIDQDLDIYNRIRSGAAGFFEQTRGLVAVWGKESVPFLNGLVTNDVAKLGDGAEMLAAFPNAQGRLLAMVRAMRRGEKILFETEGSPREKLFQNLFRFTFAGDFFAEDLSDEFSCFEMFGPVKDVYNPKVRDRFAGSCVFQTPHGALYFVPNEQAGDFREFLSIENGCEAISNGLYETLRIESGIPVYGVDMDESTIVPELGIDGLISYSKGCYIGQEIIARIHFRGHIAKQLSGLILSENPSIPPGDIELRSADGRNAGRITSAAFSPKLEKTIALGYVRYDHLEPGTKLHAVDLDISVEKLPFI